MPSVTYNGQSFAVDGRRLWILGASIQYARIPRALWPARIAAARQAGFNTIETACPWCVHEPRRDRFDFEGQYDVREFITLCWRAGMRVVLRPGPFIGTAFDGGGLPSWLTQSTEPGYAVREANEIFLERVNIYFRRLLSRLDDLQATRGGPILLVQSEHAWLCASADQADRYLREVTRVIRESGFSVPVINANDLWQESPGTIDTWRGGDDLLAHLRQLRTVQTDAPRLLSALDAAEFATWGEAPDGRDAGGDAAMVAIAQCLAAGAQPVVSPFAAGTNFGFLGGRLPGGSDRFVTTAAAAAPPLGEAGHRGPAYQAVKRIVSFAGHFDHVFAELDPTYHPIVEDAFASEGRAGGRRRGAATGPRTAIVPLRGTQGQIVFVFTDAPGREVTLLLEDGLRMPVHLGDQRVGWYVIDADLKGSGHLDYANVSPYAIVDRAILVLHGPEKTPAYVSINGTPLHVTVPSGEKPVVVDHKGITVIVCSRAQIDRTYHDLTTVYVGACGLDDEGLPIAEQGCPVWAISRDTPGTSVVRSLDEEELSAFAVTRTHRKPPRLGEWTAAPAAEYAAGVSPRYATLDGPETLAACGAPTGYGWYRAVIKGGSTAKKRYCHLPAAADRVHLYLDGGPVHLFGAGPGAESGPFDLRLSRGEQTVAALVDNLGRFADGNELVEPKGLFGHLYEVKPLRAIKPKAVKAAAVDPFAIRRYIAGLAHGQLSDTAQIEWSFKHARKTPVLVDVRGAEVTGTFVLNDRPIAYFAGAGASCHMRLMLDAEAGLKRGNNVLRFAPDPRQEIRNGGRGAAEQMVRAACLYECIDAITEGASWAFAKWEPPMLRTYGEISRTAAKSLRGVPCWWRTTFASPAPGSLVQPLWFDTAGLSKGQLFLNGHNLGRFFTATAAGKAVGPQTRLFVPSVYLNPEGENELLIFDEHGFDPFRCSLASSETGDLD